MQSFFLQKIAKIRKHVVAHLHNRVFLKFNAAESKKTQREIFSQSIFSFCKANCKNTKACSSPT